MIDWAHQRRYPAIVFGPSTTDLAAHKNLAITLRQQDGPSWAPEGLKAARRSKAAPSNLIWEIACPRKTPGTAITHEMPGQGSRGKLELVAMNAREEIGHKSRRLG